MALKLKINKAIHYTTLCCMVFCYSVLITWAILMFGALAGFWTVDQVLSYIHIK